MKPKYLLPSIIFLGIGVLFFFPEPETNFLVYSGTALFFVLLVVFLIRNNNKQSPK